MIALTAKRIRECIQAAEEKGLVVLEFDRDPPATFEFGVDEEGTSIRIIVRSYDPLERIQRIPSFVRADG